MASENDGTSLRYGVEVAPANRPATENPNKLRKTQMVESSDYHRETTKARILTDLLAS